LIKQFKTWDGSNPQIVKLAGEGQLSTTYQEPVRYPCVRPWFIITILWDGRVVPCCYDYDGKYVIGDLTTHSLKEIWNNRRMQELRRQLITGTFYDNPLCENCREAKGYPESPWYPLDPGLLRKIPLKSIWNSIQREEGSAQ
jgi:radical SAM protein with 4Fe4S-binding SPASM domain